MNILIFGAGGVGSIVGGFLARTGHNVSLLGRPWHLDVIKKQGLKITGIWGDYHLKAFDLYTDVSQIKSSDFDLIILTVKSFDTAEAVRQLKPLMKDKTMLLSLQNGLGNVEAILEAGISNENYLVGRIIFGVELEPGVAKVTVTADDTLVGELPGAKTKMSAFQMAQTLSTAKVAARAVPDILTQIWKKVIYNCALNPICSLREIPYGKILESEDTRRAMEEIIRECYAVGQKKGVKLDPPSAEGFIALMNEKLIPSTAAHTPSMLQDLRRGKRTDIEALNGAIVRYGAETGVSTPENRKVLEAIRKKEETGQFPKI